MDIVDNRIDSGKAFDRERKHLQMLDRIATEEFDVLHYAALAELKKKQSFWMSTQRRLL